jgi:hypothetical protein
MRAAGGTFVLCALTLTIGCADKAPPSPAPPRGLRPFPQQTPVATPPARPSPVPPPASNWPEDKPAEVRKDEPAAALEERDLGAELRQGLGDPSSCLHPRPSADAPKRLTIAVEAHVVGAGNVSRAYVSSPQLDAAESECLRKRVGSLRFRTPIDGAPRVVRATVEFEVKTVDKAGT